MTDPLSSVRNLNVYDIGSTSMRVRWEPVNGATGYLLTYEPVNATVPVAEKEVREFDFSSCALNWKRFCCYIIIVKKRLIRSQSTVSLLGYHIQWHQSGSCKYTVNSTNKILLKLNHCLLFCFCCLQFLNMMCYFLCADACWTISEWGSAGRPHPQYWVHFNSLCIVWWYHQWPTHLPGSDMYGHLDFCFVDIASEVLNFNFISCSSFYIFCFV